MPSLKQHQSNDYVKLKVEDVIARFNRPVLINEHGCWIWQGTTDQRGYARYGGTLVYAVVWRMSGRPILPDTEFRHQCPNRSCINPDHFLLGSHIENMADAAALGIMGQGHRRVTLEQIELVNKMLREGKMKKDIAKAIGVSPQWISTFLAGRYKYAKPC